jgi:hypothetical protein
VEELLRLLLAQQRQPSDATATRATPFSPTPPDPSGGMRVMEQPLGQRSESGFDPDPTIRWGRQLSERLREAGPDVLTGLSPMGSVAKVGGKAARRAAEETLEKIRRMQTKVAPGNNLSSLRDAAAQLPEFQNWFGGSKVVTGSGRPRVMFHGTRWAEPIDIFQGNRGMAGHFAFRPSFASEFAGDLPVPGRHPSIYPAFLKAENVFDITNPTQRRMAGIKSNDLMSGSWWRVLEDNQDKIRQGGFDSFLDYEVNKALSPSGVAVFRPHQIKSATGNRGTFDPTDPRITYGLLGALGLGAYAGKKDEP